MGRNDDPKNSPPADFEKMIFLCNFRWEYVRKPFFQSSDKGFKVQA
jgi:hypothetical protein